MNWKQNVWTDEEIQFMLTELCDLSILKHGVGGGVGGSRRAAKKGDRIVKNQEGGEAKSSNRRLSCMLFPLLIQEKEDVYAIYTIEAPLLCTAYDVRVSCRCSKGVTSEWSTIHTTSAIQKGGHSLCFERLIVTTFLWTDVFFFCRLIAVLQKLW